MLSVAVSALPTAAGRDADYFATIKGDRYCKFPCLTSLRTHNLDAQAEEFRPFGEQVGVGIETRD
jgi:hypothetical protein